MTLPIAGILFITIALIILVFANNAIDRRFTTKKHLAAAYSVIAVFSAATVLLLHVALSSLDRSVQNGGGAPADQYQTGMPYLPDEGQGGMNPPTDPLEPGEGEQGVDEGAEEQGDPDTVVEETASIPEEGISTPDELDQAEELETEDTRDNTEE